MIPVLEAILHQFPFRILGFHCDNGSEFINQNVARLLEKLLIEFTESRAYRTTDNALVEGKNGATVRKQIDYGFIASDQAEALQRFYTAHFNPYLNFHRPCGYAALQAGERGRTRRVYAADDYRTPFEKLSSLARWQSCLKPGLTAELLRQQRPGTATQRQPGSCKQRKSICSSAFGCSGTQQLFLACAGPDRAGRGRGSTASPFPLDPSPGH